MHFSCKTHDHFKTRLINIFWLGITCTFAYMIVKSFRGLSKMQDAFGFGTSKAKKYIVQENVKIKFKDVAG